MKVTKTILGRIWWLGRGTATVMGLAMLLALMLGVATTALAAVPGDPFKLGQLNAVNTITRLTGDTDNAMLRISNASRDANATALDLRVDAATLKPPMRVNSIGKVDNLNADLLNFRRADQFAFGTNGVANNADNANALDGKDSTAFANGVNGKANDANLLDGEDSTTYFSGDTYEVEDERVGTGGSNIVGRSASCDPGDKVLGGGGSGSVFDKDKLLRSELAGQGWSVSVEDNGNPSSIRAFAICADFPPLR